MKNPPFGPTNQSLTDQPINEPRINHTTPARYTVQALFFLFYVFRVYRLSKWPA